MEKKYIFKKSGRVVRILNTEVILFKKSVKCYSVECIKTQKRMICPIDSLIPLEELT